MERVLCRFLDWLDAAWIQKKVICGVQIYKKDQEHMYQTKSWRTDRSTTSEKMLQWKTENNKLES